MSETNSLNYQFFGRDNELQIHHGNFLLTDYKHRKSFVIKQSKGCKFMPKMHHNAFGGRDLPGPAGELMCSPQIPRPQWGYLLLRGRREGETGKTF